MIDDITCVVVFMDTKLIERSLKHRKSIIDNLVGMGQSTNQEQSIINYPLNQHFKDFNLASNYEDGIKK